MYFITFIEILFIVLVKNCLFEEKLYKHLKLLTPIGILLALSHKYIFSTVPNLNLVIIIIVLISTFYLITKKDIMEIIVEVIISFFWILIVELLGTIIGIMIINIVGTDSSKLQLFRSIIIIASFLVSIVLGYKLKNNDKLRFIYNIKPNKTTIGIFISFILVYLISKRVYDEFLTNYWLVIEISIYLITFIALIIIINNSVRKEVEEKNKLRLENEFKPILEEYVHKLRAREHEYKNHLNAINSMISLSANNEIKDKVGLYIDNIKNKDDLNGLLYVDNTILKSILYSKIIEAKDCGVKVIYTIKSNLTNINIEDMDLVVIVSNLLNNAIEATKGIENSFIEISISESYINNKTLYSIKVSNYVKDPQSINVSKMIEKGSSTKGNERGYGLFNVKKIVNKANGNILLDLFENILTIEITI